MKKAIKLYLQKEDEERLLAKASSIGITGRAALSRYLEKIAREPVCFLDQNVKAILGMLKVEAK